MSGNKTIRLLLPQWQGGNNPDYAFGAELLAHIVPQSGNSKLYKIDVDQNFEQELPIENGIEGESALLNQLQLTEDVLNAEKPDKVITLGGDCSVSQAPFDYLKGKYKEKLGILWLDAHPDVATINDSTRDHEMVLGNLLGHGAPRFADKVKNKFTPDEIMLAGLIYDELRPRDQDVNRLNINYATPEELQQSPTKLLDWIKENNIEYLAVHFDLDVLSPADYRSIYPAEPYLESFGAATGQLTLKQIVKILLDVSKNTEIVGLSITEHLPWDAMNLRDALSKISIFNE